MKANPTLPCHPNEVDDFLSRPNSRVIECVATIPGPFVVLGAGGKMGLHLSLMLAKALAANGRRDPVIAVSRFKSVHARDVFEAKGVTTCDCDLMDRESLARLPDAPTVFYLAGVKFGTASAPEQLHQANVLMPSHVARRFRSSRVVAFSTGCVYPFVTPASGGATETTPVAPVGDYALSCVGREKAFSDVSVECGTAVVLIRLNYSVEFRYGTLVDIAQKVFRGEPIDVTMGYLNAIWQTDAIAHSIQALELARAPAAPLNVTGPGIISVRQVAERFAELFGRRAIVTGTEAKTAWLNNAGLAHQRWGIPETSLENMMSWIAAWITLGLPTWSKPTGFERRDGRF